MNDQPQPLWQELHVPSEEEKRLFEEWKSRKENEDKEDSGDSRIVVMDI